MSEEPKSIWRKSWNLPRPFLFLGRCLLLTVLVLLATFVTAWLTGRSRDWEDFVLVILVAGVGAGVAFLYLLIRWLCCWRNLRRFLFGSVCVVTLTALFYAVENWRGSRAWKQFKSEREAKGDKFNLPDIAPPPVPDHQNFAMAPVWVETICATMGAERGRVWYGDRVAALGHTNFVHRLQMPVELWGKGLDFTNSMANWQTAETTDLKSWQEYYRNLAAITNFFPIGPQPQSPAADVLLALSRYDSTIEELRAASRLPYSRFPIGYTDDNAASILLPHLSSLKQCAMALRLRAVAELRDGQTEKALEDVRLMCRLADSLRAEPFLISRLVCSAMFQILVQPVWEGLAGRHWNDAQLAALEAEFGKFDFLADYGFVMRAEQTFAIGVIDYLRRNRHQIGNFWDGSLGLDDDERSQQKVSSFHFENLELQMLLSKLMPGGWFDQNKIAICRAHEEYLLPVVNLETRIASPAAAKRAAEACAETGERATPYNWFSPHLLPALSRVAAKSAHAQTVTDLTRIGCALERYRLAHGNFPDALDSLSPQFMTRIPHDVINGQPLKYRRTADGQFLLYSVGWNEADEGGEVVLTAKGESVSRTKGDWVWRYPAKQN